VDKLELKAALINKCINLLNNNAEIAKEAMDEAQASANEHGLPRDRYDSFRAQVLKKRDLFAQQFQKCQNDLLIYQKIDLKSRPEAIGFGSLVITTKHKILIATGVGKVVVKDDSYYVISRQTPLYQKMQGLAVGDSFEFNDGIIKILELF